MPISQQSGEAKIILRATLRQRVIAGSVLLAAAALCTVLWLSAAGKFDIGLWFGPCGFKQRHGLPCPGCGVTTATLAFMRGRIFESFYIQPAAGLMCVVLAASTFFAFVTAVFGIYFSFLKRVFTEVKVRYVIVAVITIAVAGWAVTLARALAQRQTGY
jgi:hypothetical protein